MGFRRRPLLALLFLFALLVSGRQLSSPDLGEIYARISAHFALEERLMREHDYDEYDAHKADHERLLDDLLELIDDYEEDRVEDLAAFGARLDGWFSEHFRTRDARLHRRLGV